VSQPQPYGTPEPVPPAYGPPPGYPPTGYPPAPYQGQPAYPAAYPGQAAAYPGQAIAYPGAPAPNSAYAENFAGPMAPTPMAYQAPGQVAMLSCRLCGSVPAADVTFRGHQGMIVLMRFLRFPGPFCRPCGLGTFRHMTSRTLLQGWYGYASFVITPVTLLINLTRRAKVAALAPPQPNPSGPSRPPMDPGPGLLARPLTWIGLAIPLAIIALFVLAVSSSN
jgi:hypothetical protein